MEFSDHDISSADFRNLGEQEQRWHVTNQMCNLFCYLAAQVNLVI